MSTLEERIMAIMEGKTSPPKDQELQVIPAAATSDQVEMPAQVDVQGNDLVQPQIDNQPAEQPQVEIPNAADAIDNSTQGASDDAQAAEEPPVTIENPLSVEPLQLETDPNADAEDDSKKSSEEQKEVAESTEEPLATDAKLTEEFKIKAKELFESELAARTKEVEDKYTTLMAESLQRLDMEYNDTISNLSEKIDTFIDHLSEQWVAENKPILEENMTQDISKSLLVGMKALLEAHDVEVPEAKRDLVEELQASLTETEAKLTEATEALSEANIYMKKMNRTRIIEESVKGLTELDQSRLKKLAEDVEYDTEEGFTKKVSNIKEQFFNKKDVVSQNLTEETLKLSGTNIVESSNQIKETSPQMAAYLKALNRK